MKTPGNIRLALDAWFDKHRRNLASPRALVLLSIFGLAVGVISGLLVIAFRALVRLGQAALIPTGEFERFESLAPLQVFIIPLVGGLILGIVAQMLKAQSRRAGIQHVMERLQYNEAHLPWRNLVWQFCGGVAALISGQSVGREAPSVHLGAGTASLLGQRLRLPNNAIRILVASGTAAGIAASFNTPLAGVAFAMEVVLMEYTIVQFTPVIIAAVAATVMARAVFGTAPIFYVPQLGIASQWELAYVALMGLYVAVMASLFIETVRCFQRWSARWPVWMCLASAGCAVGVIGQLAPEVLGMGYDTVDSLMFNDLVVGTLAVILGCKIIATAACVGSGMPGGLVGPTLVIGAIIGGMFGAMSNYIPGFTSNQGLLVMLGMGAMMSATLQAPLAALLAMLELTANPHLILPAMLAIVVANVMAQAVFKQESVFVISMRDAGLDYRSDPLTQSLRGIGVAMVMNRNVVAAPAVVSLGEARALLAEQPNYIIITSDDERRDLLPASDLARHLEHAEEEPVVLREIPAQREEMASVFVQSTLQQARDIMAKAGVNALYVRDFGPAVGRPAGVILRRDLEATYRLPR